MEYDSGGNAACQPGKSVRKDTPLDRLADHANTAGRIADLVENFLDRFRKPDVREGCGSDGATAPNVVRVSHADQIARLEKNLARAEELARELQSIG